MAAEISGMMPRLYGAPAYSPPPRHRFVTERPLDPDDLPLESYRSAAHEPALDDASFTVEGDAATDDWLARATRSPFGLTSR